MSKVLTFSRTFPSYHPRKGEPTYFIEKVTKSFQSLGYDRIDMPDDLNFDLGMYHICDPKSHTIRSGYRFKVGDWFSPRVWSGKPYRSKQIVIAPDIQVKKIYNFDLFTSGSMFINHSHKAYYGDIAKNDGLTPQDFCDWFKIEGYERTVKKPFNGQIICWNENINY